MAWRLRCVRSRSWLAARRRLIAKGHEVTQRGDAILAQTLDLVELVDRLPGPPLDDRFRRGRADPGEILERENSAVLRFTFPAGVSVASSTFDAVPLALVVFDWAAFAFSAIGEPIVTCGRMPSITRAETPAFARSSMLVYGRPARIFFAVAGPTPGRSASSSSAVALFKSRVTLAAVLLFAAVFAGAV